MKITADKVNRKTIRENIVLSFIMISLLAQAYNVDRYPKLPFIFVLIILHQANTTTIVHSFMLQYDAVVKGYAIP